MRKIARIRQGKYQKAWKQQAGDSCMSIHYNVIHMYMYNNECGVKNNW